MSPARSTVAWSGQHRTWQFPIGLVPTSGARLPDGSITATVFDGGQLLLVRLLPDGTAGATVIGTPASWNEGSSTSLEGLVQLELDGTDWVVRRYPLPTG